MAAEKPGSPLSPIIQLDQAAIRCPYPACTDQREQSPAWIPEPGFWAVLRHADVVEALRHPELFTQHHPEDARHPTALAALAAVQRNHPAKAEAIAMLHQQPQHAGHH